MPRYKLTIEYDGTDYNGWQIQTDCPSVQESIEIAAQQFCGEKVLVVGAGRTDSGVHASGQVAHIDLPREYEGFQVMQGINFYLFGQSKNRTAILATEPVGDDFHARFSATKRRYIYRIVNRRARLALDAGKAWHVIDELDVEAMQQAANLLIGTHDFTSFRDAQCQAKSPIKTLEELRFERKGEDIFLHTSARSFLHHQVRIMVGTLAMVGRGKWTLDDFAAALAAKSRAKGGLTAPPDGLYLTAVEY